MRIIFTFLVLFGLANCATRITKLERAIAGSWMHKPSTKFRKQQYQQRTFRQSFFEVLKVKYGLETDMRNDTLILVEYYDNICANCSFDEIALLARDTVYAVRNIDSKTRFFQDSIKVDMVRFETHGLLIGNGLWKLIVNKNRNNPFDPKLYSSPCDDGGNANITWILPGLDCRSINANCFL